MKTGRDMMRLAGVAAGILLALSVAAQNQVPRYPVQPVTAPPAIDGKLDDACWQALPEMGRFVDARGGRPPVESEVRIGYDAANLYLAAKLHDDQMEDLKAEVKQRDGGVFGDDVLEWFISPADPVKVYYAFRLNSIGTMEESSMDAAAPGFNCDWQGAAVRAGDHWSIEMAIPFKSLGVEKPQPFAVWRGNACRFRAHKKEISSWSNCKGSFHNMSAFGELLFLDRALFTGLDAATAPLATGGELVLSANGPDGQFRTRVYSQVDGAPAPTQWGRFAVTGGKGGATYQTLLDGERLLFQGEIIEQEQPCRVLYRSALYPAKEVDPALARLNRIKAALAGFSEMKVPPRFQALAATWADRAKALETQADELASRRLAQEIQAVAWLSGLKPEQQDAGWLYFQVPSFSDFDYDYLPEPGRVGAEPKLRGIRGEYEPLCLRLMPLAGDAVVQVEMADLKNADGVVLPASAWDPTVLKAWYQNGRGGFQDTTGTGVWMNELILHDDNIIESDPVRMRNNQLSTKDSSTLRPVKIQQFQSREFWLTLHVPLDQPPGVYQGQVKATANGQTLLVPIRVEILPVTMEPTDFTWSMYYYGRLGLNATEDKWYEADLKSMAAHGFTALATIEGADCQMDGKKVAAYDLTHLRRGLELRKQYGLDGKTITSGSWYNSAVDRIYRVTLEQLRQDPEHEHNWKLFGTEMNRLAKEIGIEQVFVYAYDEPGYDATGVQMKKQELVCRWAKDAGFATASAITLDGARQVKGLLTLPVLDVNGAVIGPDRRQFEFDETWLYWHPHEEPTYDRLLAGLFIWYGGFTGACPWIYKMDLREWDDWFKNPYGYRLQNYVYPGEDGPVATIQYEGFREGSEDVRLLEMLDRYVKALVDKDLDATEAAALAAARDLLDHAPAKFHGQPGEVSSRVTGQDLAEFRDRVLDLLAALSPAYHQEPRSWWLRWLDGFWSWL